MIEWLERPGAELREPLRHTPPEIRVGAAMWEPHYGVRAGRNARLAMTLVLIGPTAFLMVGGLLLVVLSRAPMLGILMMMFAVPASPIAKWIYQDLWRPRN